MSRSLDSMIAQQVRLWEQQRAEASKREAETKPWPVITISREFGARGVALGRLLEQRVGFAVWDNEIVHEMAEMTGANEAVLRSLDEHRRAALEDVVRGALMGSAYTNSEYLKSLMEIIHTIADHGRSIIVGRGAPYILDAKDILSLRLVCPIEHRVAGYATRQGLSEKKARQQVEKMDGFRADFMRHHFDRDIADPSTYDLVMNSGLLSLDALADITLAAYEAKFGRRPVEVD